MKNLKNSSAPSSIRKSCWLFLLFTGISISALAQKPVAAYARIIDSLLAAPAKRPFNGIVQVLDHGRVIYEKVSGYADVERSRPLHIKDRFLIGSVSKQMSAVLVLRAVEKGRIDLQSPVGRYLPRLTQPWAKQVTIHQLLTHTHGIPEDRSPTTEFAPGTGFHYTQVGYALLMEVLESTSTLSFDEQAKKLFKECGMHYTAPPGHADLQLSVRNYTCDEQGKPVYVPESLTGVATAAGGFIATAGDLALWNKALFGGKLLRRKMQKMMMTIYPGAIRQHPLFGETRYGYGITIDTTRGLKQYGQTGYVTGSASMDFYFPETKVQLIVFNNIVRYPQDLNASFSYHMKMLEAVRSYCKEKIAAVK